VNIDKTKLIPASLKLMREQSQKKYFQQNMLLNDMGDQQIVLKSKKGEDVI
jgi:hypothetical protein